MSKLTKNQLTTADQVRGGKLRRRLKIGELDSYKFSAVDLAIFGAAFALLADKAGRASTDKVFREVLKQNQKSPLDFDPKEFLIEVGGNSAEALTFSGLLTNLRSDLVKKADKSFAEKYIIDEPLKVNSNSTEDSSEEEFKLEDILDLDGSLVTQTANEPSAENADKNVEGNYTAQMKLMQNASEEFLEVMRDLFAKELEALIAKNQEQDIDSTKEIQQPIEIAEIEAEGGGSYYALLGLLGFGGGGGGGGGLLSAIGSGAAGRLFSGFGIDGYVSGATVFWDIDGDFIQDANETVETTTDSTGFYELNGVTAGVGQIVIKEDGVDTNTGGSVGMMAASTSVTDSTNAHVTPLTLLKAQGVSEDTIMSALGVDLGDDISIDNYNPMAILEDSLDDSELDTAGTVLLKAQQIFSVVNSVAGLAEESGMTQSEALAATVGAIGDVDLSLLVGEDGGDTDALTNVISTVAPTFASVAADAAASLKNVNAVLGESLANPKDALGENARAAALITQDDLVTSFRAIGKLDPNMASTEIASKLSSFNDVDAIKTNFRDIYAETIRAQADSEGGIITGLDSYNR